MTDATINTLIGAICTLLPILFGQWLAARKVANVAKAVGADHPETPTLPEQLREVRHNTNDKTGALVLKLDVQNAVAAKNAAVVADASKAASDSVAKLTETAGVIHDLTNNTLSVTRDERDEAIFELDKERVRNAQLMAILETAGVKVPDNLTQPVAPQGSKPPGGNS